MLQVRSLVKVYKPKRGVPVTALAGINLTLPEKGMVFLLGKSGSGKSTLLNILGGLDRYNSGDILVMGKSTRSWRQSHFDSYRNTYVGFIFQEYNILNEFSVGANIGLALQLQGQKATTERINEILRQVDLEGYGTRNPNELSGGQKQRVAIARALVKNPKIIMADEPTGALDSNTGRQVLTTLKKLSRDKLVIVVSHDREFAEQYADRIVELADGKIIRDVERLQTAEVAEAVPVYMEDSVNLPEEYVLTAADKTAICDYIQKMIGMGKQPKFSLFSKNSATFQPTDESRISLSREGYKLIKSRLPMKYAFKLGASGLKHKKFRLVMTILLSCIALGMFGLTDTFASYSYVDTATKSLSNQKVSYAAFEKAQEHKDDMFYGTDYMDREDLERIRKKTGLTVYPVYGCAGVVPGIAGEGFSGDYYMLDFAGCIPVDQQLLEDMGATVVAGKLPEKDSEVMISTHMLETYINYGYQKPFSDFTRTETVETAEDVLGKEITVNGSTVTICGVVDSGMDYSRYEHLKDFDYSSVDQDDFAAMVMVMVQLQELEYARRYSLDGLLMTTESFAKASGNYKMLMSATDSARVYLNGMEGYIGQLAYLTEGELSRVTWLDGKSRTELAPDEVVLTVDQYNSLAGELINSSDEAYYRYDYQYQKEHGGRYYAPIAELPLKLKLCYEPEYFYYEVDISAIAGEYDLKLVGILEETSSYYSERVLLSKDMFGEEMPDMILQTLSPMPTSTQQIRKLVEFSARDFDSSKDGILQYNLMNPVCFELKNMDMILDVLASVFVWIGLVFVIFASLLFSSFIGTSISYKKEQIGILRAIGSRGADVFRIFFAESFIIAMINFVLSFGGTILVCAVLNEMLKRETGLLLTILNVGLRQALLLLGVCLLSAFVATFIPTRKIAAKRPIDAIRDR